MANQNIKKNIVYNFLKTCSTLLFPLITYPYISRVLKPENIGKYDFGQSIVSYFSLIATLGITTYAIRECSTVNKNKEKLNDLASQIFSINIFTTIIAYICLSVSLFVFKPLVDYRFLIMIQSTSILMTTLGADWLNSAMEDFKYIAIRTFTFQLISLILMFLFVKEPKDYLIYAIISVVSSSGANIINIFYRRKFCKITFTTNINWKLHIRPIILLFVMLLSQLIFSNADKTMLGIIKGDYEVGIYSAAVKVTNIVRQVVLSILWVIMPRLSIYFAENQYEKINLLLRRILSFTIIVGLPCVVGVEVLAKEIVLVIAGEDFFGSILVLRILMISLFFSFFGGSFIGNIILLPAKKEKDYMVVCCITAIINVIANGIFIPYFGVNGAAITTVLSEFLILVLLLPKVDKKIHIENKINLIKAPLVGCFGIIVFCEMIFKLVNSLILRTSICVLGSIVVYGVTVILMKDETIFSLVHSIQDKIKEKTYL